MTRLWSQRHRWEPDISGHSRRVEEIADPRSPKHEELLDWVGGSYDPEEFDPAKVEFDDPRVRWKNTFADDA